MRASGGVRPAAEHIAKSEQVAEDIVEIDEDGRVESAAWAAVAANPGVSEAIVARALLGVSQDRVGFAALLEVLFRFRIVGIAVGMILQRQLAIGALDLLIVRGARDAQYFVIIAFHVRSQNVTSVRKRFTHGDIEIKYLQNCSFL